MGSSGESATAMSGAKGEGMWGMDKVDDSEPQKRTYFMWVNTKLEEGGHSRIGLDSMWVDFKNGVVLANLVSSLCDVKASKKFPDEEGNAIAPIDDGHSDIKDVRSRLDQLNSMLKGFKEKERDLREMVQNAVDEQFDAENLPGAHWYKANYD